MNVGTVAEPVCVTEFGPLLELLQQERIMMCRMGIESAQAASRTSYTWHSACSLVTRRRCSDPVPVWIKKSSMVKTWSQTPMMFEYMYAHPDMTCMKSWNQGRRIWTFYIHKNPRNQPENSTLTSSIYFFDKVNLVFTTTKLLLLLLLWKLETHGNHLKNTETKSKQSLPKCPDESRNTYTCTHTFWYAHFVGGFRLDLSGQSQNIQAYRVII